jgi:transposase
MAAAESGFLSSSGALPLRWHAGFVSLNRRRTAIKLLAHDGQGFWLCMKRLSKGRFRYWPEGTGADLSQRQLLAHELSVLLAAGDPQRTLAAPQWRRVAP